MSIALICWGRFPSAAGNITVPAPTTEVDAPWLWDYLAQQATSLGKVGFTHIQLPPASKCQGGAGAGCDGYGVYDLRDIGSKKQCGSVQTRYGSRESLLRLVATAHAAGLKVSLDIVLHQLDGGDSGVYEYLGADGKTKNGRGPMQPSCFRGDPPRRPEDDVPVPADDFAFGDEKVFQNCEPAGYTISDAIDFGTWLFDTTGADMARFDDTKGTWAPFVKEFMTSGAMANKAFVSEYFDGDPANLNWWVTTSPMDSRSGVEDFTLHWRLQAACNGFDATQFDHDGFGYWQWNAGLAYGFVDNPDTDVSPGEQVVFNKGIAYAVMLNLPLKMAFVYGKDWMPASVWPGAYGLKPLIDNLVWISRTFAIGKFERRWVDRDVYAYTRDGDGGSTWSGGLLVAVNFNVLTARTVTVQTMWAEGTWVHDYTGHGGDLTVGAGGMLTLTIPSNAYSAGTSYCCYAPGGVHGAAAVHVMDTHQTISGYPDLDTGVAVAGATTVVGRVWAESEPSLSCVPATLLPTAALVDGWWEISIENPLSVDESFDLAIEYQGKAVA